MENETPEIKPSVDQIERKAKLEHENFEHQIKIAETLRELLTTSLEWPIMIQLEARMNIGEHCGIAGIKTSSITCERPEYERRKDNGEL